MNEHHSGPYDPESNLPLGRPMLRISGFPDGLKGGVVSTLQYYVWDNKTDDLVVLHEAALLLKENSPYIGCWLFSIEDDGEVFYGQMIPRDRSGKHLGYFVGHPDQLHLPRKLRAHLLLLGIT